MDAVAADLSPDHVDHVTRLGSLVVALSAIGEAAGHDAHSAAVDQRLADVALVEHHGAVDSRYS